LTPAAYHRQAAQDTGSKRFVALGSRLVLLSMFPLMTAICLDFYLIAQRILASRTPAALLAAGLFLIFFGLWFLLPRVPMGYAVAPLTRSSVQSRATSTPP